MEKKKNLYTTQSFKVEFLRNWMLCLVVDIKGILEIKKDKKALNELFISHLNLIYIIKTGKTITSWQFCLFCIRAHWHLLVMKRHANALLHVMILSWILWHEKSDLLWCVQSCWWISCTPNIDSDNLWTGSQQQSSWLQSTCLQMNACAITALNFYLLQKYLSVSVYLIALIRCSLIFVFSRTVPPSLSQPAFALSRPPSPSGELTCSPAVVFPCV